MAPSRAAMGVLAVLATVLAGLGLVIRRDETFAAALFAEDDAIAWEPPVRREVAADVASAYVRVGGVDVHYYAAAARGACRGAVVLLHGGSYDARTWIAAGTMSALARGGFDAYAIDEPGHGETVGDADVGDGVFLRRVLDALGVFAGGAAPAILAASAGGYYANPYVGGGLGAVGAYVPVAAAGAGGYAWATVATPTLFVYGSDDEYGIGQADRPIFETMPNETTYEMANASHACYLDDPAAFNGRVVSWLARIPLACPAR